MINHHVEFIAQSFVSKNVRVLERYFLLMFLDGCLSWKLSYLRHLSLLRHFPGRVAQLVKWKRVICVFLLNLLVLSSFLKVIVISTSAISDHEASANIMRAHLTFLRT